MNTNCLLANCHCHDCEEDRSSYANEPRQDAPLPVSSWLPTPAEYMAWEATQR